MSSFNINSLLHALNNESNENVLDTTTKEIQKIKNDMLQKLQLSRDALKSIHKKLKKYKYVDDMSSIHVGRYVRWISLKNPSNIKLTNGGIICDITPLEDNIQITCKNNRNMLFSFKLNECFVFQRLTDQEQIILSAVNYLAT